MWFPVGIFTSNQTRPRAYCLDASDRSDGHHGRARHARRRLVRARCGRSGPAVRAGGGGRREDAAGGAEVRGRGLAPAAAHQRLAREGDPTRRGRRADHGRRGRGRSRPGRAPTPSRPAPPPRPCAARTRRAAATTPSTSAVALGNGVALPPLEAPEAVKQIIEAGNGIARTPYIWGGGHGKWQDTGYDCSGSVSFALAAAGLLNAPLASGPLMSWGEAGKGKWVTIYANAGHVFLEVAGVRFDTSATARHRLALDQRGALHRGLRRAAPRRPLATFEAPWGVHPMNARVGPSINRSASSWIAWRTP